MNATHQPGQGLRLAVPEPVLGVGRVSAWRTPAG